MHLQNIQIQLVSLVQHETQLLILLLIQGYLQTYRMLILKLNRLKHSIKLDVNLLTTLNEEPSLVPL